MRHAYLTRELNPMAAWTQSALGWTEFVRGNIDQARSFSKRGLRLAPNDLSVLDFDSLIGVFGGDFNYVLETANPADFQGQSLQRHLFNISYAVASYYLGNYPATIEGLNQAASDGAPADPVSYAYLIAAYQRSGQEEMARLKLADFLEAWPDSRLESIVQRLFVRPQDAESLFDALREAGWTSPAQ